MSLKMCQELSQQRVQGGGPSISGRGLRAPPSWQTQPFPAGSSDTARQLSGVGTTEEHTDTHPGTMVCRAGRRSAVATEATTTTRPVKWPIHGQEAGACFSLLSQTCLLTQLPRLQKASLHFHLQNQYEIPRGLV